MKRLCLFAACLLAAAGPARAEDPVRREQFVYSILAFNGKDYSGTFTIEEADTFYLMAGVDNFLTARKTLVYFWPITGDWKMDAESLNQVFEGKVELTGPGGRPLELQKERYTYYNVQGEYELNWKVDRAAAADAAWKRYEEIVNGYYQAMGRHYEAQAAYEARLNELSLRISRLREAKRDVTALVEELKGLQAPEPPQPPRDYIVPPSPVQEAFILNLPVGEYGIRFLVQDAAQPDRWRVMEGSEKRIVVFERRRTNGIGFEVIPADKWTRPVESKTPSSVLYVDGTADLYLRPFFQDEFNDLAYEKMRRNDAKGNPDLMKWVRLQQVPQARLQVARPGLGPEEVLEAPYYVEQVKGAALGYKIVPFDPEGAHQDRDPSLRAFHIPIRRQNGVIRLQVRDKTGVPLPGGGRQIRVVVQSRLRGLMFLLAVAPFAVLAAVAARRSRQVTG